MTTNHREFSKNFKATIAAAIPPKKTKRVLQQKVERNLSEIDKCMDALKIQKNARTRAEMVLNTALAVTPMIKRLAAQRKRWTPTGVVTGRARSCDVAAEVIRQQNGFMGMNYQSITRIVRHFFMMNPHYGIVAAERGRASNIDRVTCDHRFEINF